MLYTYSESWFQQHQISAPSTQNTELIFFSSHVTRLVNFFFHLLLVISSPSPSPVVPGMWKPQRGRNQQHWSQWNYEEREGHCGGHVGIQFQQYGQNGWYWCSCYYPLIDLSGPFVLVVFDLRAIAHHCQLNPFCCSFHLYIDDYRVMENKWVDGWMSQITEHYSWLQF